MEELDISLVIKRSLTGIAALVTRSIFIQALNFVTFFTLTIILSPATIGVYSLATAVIAFLAYFSDIGLAGALIQKKDDITNEDLNTTFYLQQVLVIFASILAICIGPWVKVFYHLGDEGLWLYYMLVFSFFVSSLKTIPSILLERNLRFDRLVIPQVVETIFFDVTVVSLAFMGLGVKSFIIAIFARDMAGLIAIYVVRPWRPRLLFSKIAAKHLLSFGIPFQFNSFLALLKDNLLLVVLGKLLPFTAIGYIGFAQKWAYAPLRLVMDNVIRISFPSFSRLQHDKQVLGVALSRSIFLVTALVFPGLSLLCLLFVSLIHIIPKYNRWEPAIIILIIFSCSAAIAAITTPITSALNAIKHIVVTLSFMLVWTALTWLLVPFSAIKWGYVGVASSLFVVSFTSFFLLPIAQKRINFSLWTPIKPAIASLAAIGGGIFINNTFPYSYSQLLLLTITFSSIYLCSLFLLARQEILCDIQFIRQYLIHKKNE